MDRLVVGRSRVGNKLYLYDGPGMRGSSRDGRREVGIEPGLPEDRLWAQSCAEVPSRRTWDRENDVAHRERPPVFDKATGKAGHRHDSTASPMPYRILVP